MEKRDAINRIIKLIVQAQDIALKADIPNLLQPGLVKEMIVADILGHELITSKRDADACDPEDSSVKFEYLSCYEGGTGQLDRMFKSPQGKRAESLQRITRNQAIYFAIFYKKHPLKPKVIYKVSPKKVREETERQLDRSRNVISHVGFPESWVRNNGTVVYEDEINNYPNS